MIEGETRIDLSSAFYAFAYLIWIYIRNSEETHSRNEKGAECFSIDIDSFTVFSSRRQKQEKKKERKAFVTVWPCEELNS